MLGILRDLLQGGKKKQNPQALNQIQSQPANFQQAFQSGGLTKDQPLGYGKPTNYGVPQDNMVDTPYGYVGNASPRGGLRVQQGQGMQPNMFPQYEDAYTPDLALNQTYTQGNPQLTRPGYKVQRGANPNDPYSELRRILGY